MRKWLIRGLLLGVLIFLLTGCKQDKGSEPAESSVDGSSDEIVLELETSDKAEETKETSEETEEVPEGAGAEEDLGEEDLGEEDLGEKDNVDKVIVIDAGHQARGNSSKEPVGPGAGTTKAKVTSGTSGRYSGLKESELNLSVAIKLKSILEARGYQVIMVRESQDVDISNSERAQVANEAKADAFIRVHANGSEASSANGMMTICQTASNPYNKEFYPASKKLSQCVLDAAVEATGAKKERVWETDTMTGINWAMVPSTIIEMGYMSNKKEDLLLASDDYQMKIATGIANGVDRFFQ